MPRPQLARNVRPITEFRANVAAFVEQLRSTREPILLTQHGSAVAVVIDIEAYDALVEELDTLRDLRTATDEAATGATDSHERTAARLRAVALRL